MSSEFLTEYIPPWERGLKQKIAYGLCQFGIHHWKYTNTKRSRRCVRCFVKQYRPLKRGLIWGGWRKSTVYRDYMYSLFYPGYIAIVIECVGSCAVPKEFLDNADVWFHELVEAGIRLTDSSLDSAKITICGEVEKVRHTLAAMTTIALIGNENKIYVIKGDDWCDHVFSKD